MKKLGILFFMGFVVLGLYFGYDGFTKHDDVNADFRREVAQAADDSNVISNQGSTHTWALGGYLPSNPNQKVYLILDGHNIADIQTAKPSSCGSKACDTIVDTESLIFPGLIDMHSHIKYNVLPLWGDAQAQFINRFEWRKKYPPYKQAVSFNMKALKGDPICAAVRWAELKALVGGVTSLQGIGGDSKCAAGFGVHNLELPGEFGVTRKVRATTDLIDPSQIGAIYIPNIEKGVLSAPPGSDTNAAYDKALFDFLTKSKVVDWVKTYNTAPRSIATGLQLAIGDSLGVAPNDVSQDTWNKIQPQLTAYLKNNLKLNDKDTTAEVANLNKFLWGQGTKGFVGSVSKNLPASITTTNDLFASSDAMRDLPTGAIKTIDSKVRRYLGMYEAGIRRSILKAFAAPGDQQPLAEIVHLAEGMNNDPSGYNNKEYTYTKELGLARPGMVFIHGVGLTDADLQDAAKNKISLVWSPFSNLLLYGQTLNVVKARGFGLNVALGADWSPTGSKNLLGEFKIARRYLNAQHIPTSSISDKDLVDMATVNAAKALNLTNRIGSVAKGLQADLMLVSKVPGQDPYTTLVETEEQDVNLTVVSGDPLYGNSEYINQVAQAFGDKKQAETLPLNQSACSQEFAHVTKGFRNPYFTKLDSDMHAKGLDYTSAASIQNELTSKFAAYAATVPAAQQKDLVKLDPMFVCEDARYQKMFADFIEKSLATDAAQRAQTRAAHKLDDKWTPLSSSSDDDDDDSM